MQIVVALPSGTTVPLTVDPADGVAELAAQLRQHLLLTGTEDVGSGRWVFGHLGHPLAGTATLADQGVTDGAELDLVLVQPVGEIAVEATDATALTVTWAAHPDATVGYALRWSADAGVTWSPVVTTTETTVTVPDLVAGTEYVIEIDLADGDGTRAASVTVTTAETGTGDGGTGETETGDGGTGETGTGDGGTGETGTGDGGTGDPATDPGTEHLPAPEPTPEHPVAPDPAPPAALTPTPIVPVAAPLTSTPAPARQLPPATAPAETAAVTAAPVAPPVAPANDATVEIGLTSLLLVAGVIAAARFSRG